MTQIDIEKSLEKAEQHLFHWMRKKVDVMEDLRLLVRAIAEEKLQITALTGIKTQYYATGERPVFLSFFDDVPILMYQLRAWRKVVDDLRKSLENEVLKKDKDKYIEDSLGNKKTPMEVYETVQRLNQEAIRIKAQND